jgi:hypothetical protein
MEQHDIEIEINKEGEVRVHVTGAKGKACMSYMEFFEKLVGPAREKQMTHEYYEPDTKARLDLTEEQKVRTWEE